MNLCVNCVLYILLNVMECKSYCLFYMYGWNIRNDYTGVRMLLSVAIRIYVNEYSYSDSDRKYLYSTVTVTENVYTGDSDRKCLYRRLNNVIWYDLCIWMNSVTEYWSWCDDVYGMMFIEKIHIVILLMYEYIAWYV